MVELFSEWRRQFDAARTPYDARIAIGITFVEDSSAPLPSFQPVDGDLTALSALSGTNTIYYRSGPDTWSAVTMGSGMTFTAGILNSVPGPSGISDAPSDSILYGRKNAAWIAVPPAGGGVEEAPSTGLTYGRQDTVWRFVCEEAPFTDSPYVRQNGTWVNAPALREAELLARIEALEARVTALGG